MRASTILPLVFVAASVAPSFALPLAPTAEPHAHTHSNEPNAPRKAGLHTAQHASPRLHGAQRHAGQRRPEWAASAIAGQPQRLAAGPRPAGQQHYRRPHPSESTDRDIQQPQRQSQQVARAFDELLARELEEELEARKVNWKKVGSVVGDIGKTVLHFLREDGDGQLLGRDFDEALFARELANELEARKVNWKKVGSVVGDIGKTVLHFLREDGEMPVYARDLGIDDSLFEREVAEGSGAISFKNILKDGEQFIGGVFKREDEEMLARSFDDELMDRDMILDELD
ncbi:hypothetical protein FOMPIDRAFT_116799 [Fomitopsis schrenkii]|uniref:Uncharacterized protein n=1 Tax=Fomitopsis schrenkii TaxID=2126942 RepID=S8DUY3_FOMSC|nr:hypothetical protein FOMPIDRAFT_116799 [Fomitopsis schrenkii]